MMDPLWSETCWSTFKYFIILIASTYYILCINWTVKRLLVHAVLRYFYMHLYEQSGWYVFDTYMGARKNSIKLHVNKSSWGWTLRCSKHVEDTISKLKQYCKKCAFCSILITYVHHTARFNKRKVTKQSNQTPTWCNTVQVLFLQGHSTCFGRKRPSSGVFKTSTWATGTCVIVAGKSSHLLIRAGTAVSALIRRCDDWPATITHVPHVLVLNTPDDGRLRPKHVEWPCRNKTCTVLHQVGVSFDLRRT